MFVDYIFESSERASSPLTTRGGRLAAKGSLAESDNVPKTLGA